MFIGNNNQSVDILLKISSLFGPFPKEIGIDTVFLDGYIAIFSSGKFR